LDDARNPLAVEVLARHDDDAAVAPEQGRGQNPSVPEREDWLSARGDDRVVVREAVDAPAIGRAEALDDRRGGRREPPGLPHLLRRQAGLCHMPSYWGPPPPSGGTQSMIWEGSMVSHVLECTPFRQLTCSRLVPSPASTIS